jgi:hypothetical protein
LNDIEKIFYKCLWNGKKDKIKRSIIINVTEKNAMKNILDGRKRGYNDMDGLLLLVDFEKAFDSIEYSTPIMNK